MQYGMNALKLWLLNKNASPFKNLSSETSDSALKNRIFYKSDILQLSSEELQSYLVQFVRDTDNSSEYNSGVIYFLCLSIQFFLLKHGKRYNIFTDKKYDTFSQVLHDALLQQETKALLQRQPLIKKNEEVLWESNQLGVQSPVVLLNTLIYFYVKYFKLKTVEEHAQLHFSNVVIVTNKETQNSFLRYYPNGANKNNNENDMMEIKERPDCLIRCPVKLYEFYLQRCPPQAFEKNYPLYLEPERDCSPERNVWYSPHPMSRDLISRQLQRLKFIQEAEL